MIKTEELLKELILIPSFDGNEGVIREYLYGFLNKEGFDVENYPVNKNRFNIVAKLGNPKIYLSAHMDTVDPPLAYKETSNYIYGRGACDTKGSIAAMIVAGVTAKKEGISNFGLIFTVGEETTLDGVKEIIQSKLKIPFVVIGEPTSLKIVNGHYGILIMEVTTKGKAVHSSQPRKGINAIDILLEAIKQVQTITIYPETLMSLVQIEGGVADNIIPDKAKAIFSFRMSPNDNLDYLEMVETLVDKNIKVKILQEVKAVYSDIPKELSFVESAGTVKYLTELSFYKKGVVLGPGDIQDAHGNNEKISRRQLSEAVKIYSKILMNYSKEI